ncbi:MAG: hypothetical protein SF339_05115 [Blastocatellia bacterium]|nr:hypothetical protein [Blastocatellia bacterium]
MQPISPLSQYVFVALVALVAAAFFRGMRRGGATMAAGLAPLVIWLGAAALAAGSGILKEFDRLPPPLLLLAGSYAGATVGLAFSSVGTRLIEAEEIRWLIGFQAFRVPLELLLHRLCGEGVVPVQMTYAGRNFDIVAGLLAIALFLWATFGRLPRWAILAFNLIGLALLVNIVTIAILSTPTPLRQFWNEPANTFITDLPFVWLPTFLVQAALFGHVLVFRWLRKSR